MPDEPNYTEKAAEMLRGYDAGRIDATRVTGFIALGMRSTDAYLRRLAVPGTGKKGPMAFEVQREQRRHDAYDLHHQPGAPTNGAQQ